MKNNRFTKLLTPDTKIHLWIMTLFVMVITYYNKIIGAVGILVLLYFIYYNWQAQHNRKEMWTKYIENLSFDIDSVTRHVVLELPISLAIVEFDGSVSWYNSKFSQMLNTKDLLEKNIEDLIPNLELETILQNKEEVAVEVTINDRYYKVLYNIVKTNREADERYIIMLYWVDITEFHQLKVKYNEERSVVMLIEVDNYDDVLKNTEEANKPLVIAEIDKSISLWGANMNAAIQKYQKDKYIVFLENQYLECLESKKFNILDEIREIQVGNQIPITLSIGVGVGGKNPTQLDEYAKAAMDLALGRGGDQAVVKKIRDFDFYGGKTKAVEKRNKVKARVIAHALRQLIDQSKDIVIMGHKFPDMDSLGAALGVYRAAKNRGKDAYIVLNSVNESIRNLVDRIKSYEEYKFITSEEFLNRIDKDTLVVVVDTHRPNFTQCPQSLNIAERIVLIDHHRRGAEFIENAVLTYLEPYASSACELVSEILQYMYDKINIEKIEAEALLAGITVDTKNFSFKTGVRTFEAASWLRRAGADTTNVRQLFQDDLKTFISIADVVKNAKEIGNNIALSVCPESIENISLVAAQGADELLNIRGITASFVLGIREEEEIIISGRSLGDINVQVILEKLGGGGHLTVAGAQIKDQTIEDATSMLRKSIDEYFEEGEE